MNLLAAGLHLIAETDPERPAFHRMVSPICKFQGDNPDAIYYSTLIRDDRAYRIQGNIAGATYTSISMETGSAEGHYPTGVARAISDKELKIAPDGGYEMILSPTERPGNWFKLEPGTGSVTTRHYFEAQHCVAADRMKVIPLTIAPLDPVAPQPGADRRIDRRQHSRRRQLAARLYLGTDADDESGQATAQLGFDRAEPVQPAGAARRRDGFRQSRRALRRGAVSAEAGRGAGDRRALPQRPIRECHAMEPLSPDL